MLLSNERFGKRYIHHTLYSHLNTYGNESWKGEERGWRRREERGREDVFLSYVQVSIHSISENAVCQYRVVVGVPEVCGHPQFSGVVNKPETWVLELSEV